MFGIPLQITLETVESDDDADSCVAEHRQMQQHLNSNFKSEEIEIEAMLETPDDKSSLLRKIRQESNQRCGFCGLEVKSTICKLGFSLFI